MLGGILDPLLNSGLLEWALSKEFRVSAVLTRQELKDGHGVPNAALLGVKHWQSSCDVLLLVFLALEGVLVWHNNPEWDISQAGDDSGDLAEHVSSRGSVQSLVNKLACLDTTVTGITYHDFISVDDSFWSLSCDRCGLPTRGSTDDAVELLAELGNFGVELLSLRGQLLQDGGLLRRGII